jgi:hypothetical protein
VLVRDVLIDLGEMPARRAVPAAIAAARRPFPLRAVLGAFTLVLVALLAGAAPHPPPVPPTIIPGRLGDATFVGGDRLHVVSSGRSLPNSLVQNRVINTYSLPDARLLDRTQVAVSGGVTWVWQGAGTVVVSYQVDTTGAWAVVAVAAGTERVLWRRAARWVGGSAGDGLVVLDTDQAELGVELATGQTRWSVPHPADGFTSTAGDQDGFPRWLVTVTDSGRLETRDARTGTVLAEATASRLTGRANGLIWPVGDLVLVDTGGSGFDAYRLPDLRKVWRTSADLSQSWTQASCDVVICTFRQQRGMTALDAATGRVAWSSEQWGYAEAVGDYLIATTSEQAGGTPGLWVLDPATGRPLGDFGAWQGLGPAGNGLFYGKLDVPGEYRGFYAVLDPATRRVRILGTAEKILGDCETTTDVLICRRTDASVALWRLG